jgi:TLD
LNQVLNTSVVLSHVSEAVRAEFITKVRTEWLPTKKFRLLYRGTRDGTTPKAFHDLCDMKGPTLVLIVAQSPKMPVCVFGGYAAKRWERGGTSTFAPESRVDARDSFLFTVVNPFGDGVVKMPINQSSHDVKRALVCKAGFGPTFGSAIFIAGKNGEATGDYTKQSGSCWIQNADDTYGDPLGRGSSTFTGDGKFTVIDVEVWAVGSATVAAPR